MKNSIFNEFEKLNGSKFIKFNSYQSKTTGEIANFIINVNVNEHNMKVNDLEKLKSLTDSDLLTISESKNIALDIVKLGFNELVLAAEKNLSENQKDRSNASIAQTEAYVHITKGVKLNKETMKLYVCGLELRKEVVVKGTYKSVNSSDKTIAKKQIQKVANLSCLKYRNYIFENADQLKISGRIIDLK